MADFCKQCSLDIFGQDFKDVAGLVSKEQVQAGYVANVLCEGCGVTQVDDAGNCLGGCLCEDPVHREKYGLQPHSREINAKDFAGSPGEG